MAIVKVVAIDPKEPMRPLCFQVPGNSRELQLLLDTLHRERMDHRVFTNGHVRPRWVRQRKRRVKK